ncbi:MAG: alpha/beta hydrolase [Thermodesulfobacteriota bacterium]|nr:alpha/beta hydrolase [Thermodesulfobacteriota bacterium]
MAFVNVNGIKHHYLQQGEGQDVVLIHGMGGNMSFWYANKALAGLKGDFRVTVYDMRGHGYSGFAETGYTSFDLAMDLGGLMEAIGLSNAFLVGHSLGGLVALHMAHLFPDLVAGMILAEGNIPALRHLIDLEKWPYRKQREDMLREINPKLPEILNGFNMYYLEYRLKELREGKAINDLVDFGMRKGLSIKANPILKLLDETTIKTDIKALAGLTEDCIKKIEQTTLALYGQFSPLIPICDYLHENMPACRRVVVPEACHLFPARLPDQFVQHVRHFLLSVTTEEDQFENEYATT